MKDDEENKGRQQTSYCYRGLVLSFFQMLKLSASTDCHCSHTSFSFRLTKSTNTHLCGISIFLQNSPSKHNSVQFICPSFLLSTSAFDDIFPPTHHFRAFTSLTSVSLLCVCVCACLYLYVCVTALGSIWCGGVRSYCCGLLVQHGGLLLLPVT